MDEKKGFRTTQLLCMPVAASSGEVIGAVQVLNTKNGMSFSQESINLLSAFRVHVKVAIMNQHY